MKRMLPHDVAHRQSLRWRHRTHDDAMPASFPLVISGEWLTPSRTVLQRDDLSADAKQLYCALRESDEYVVCIDPPVLSSRVGVSEQNLRTCLNELTRAGVISTCLGNLVFFR